MNFSEALNLMKKGHKVRRKCWTEYSDAPKYYYLGKKNIHNQDKKSVRLCSIHSLDSDDWEIYQEENKCIFLRDGRCFSDYNKFGKCDLIKYKNKCPYVISEKRIEIEIKEIWPGLDTRITTINDRTKNHTIQIKELEKKIKELEKKND